MGYIQCSAIPNDKKDEPGDAGGCDQIAAFPVGRNVTLVDPKPGLNCKSGRFNDVPGFVGCAQ